jgi:hypothetical protein
MSGHEAFGGQRTKPLEEHADTAPFGVRSGSSRLPTTAETKIFLSP